jgi:hypothetical protein
MVLRYLVLKVIQHNLPGKQIKVISGHPLRDQLHQPYRCIPGSFRRCLNLP